MTRTRIAAVAMVLAVTVLGFGAGRAEADGARVPTVLSTNADFQSWIGFPSQLYRHLDELPYTRLVERLEGVISEDPVLDVKWQESPRVISRQPESRLRKVVGAE